MADRELIIKLKYDASQAEKQAEAFHANERKRIAETAAAAAGAAQSSAQAQARAYKAAAQSAAGGGAATAAASGGGAPARVPLMIPGVGSVPVSLPGPARQAAIPFAPARPAIALPGPGGAAANAPGALIRTLPNGTQIFGPGGGGLAAGGGAAGSGGIPITPRVAPGQPGAPGGSGGAAGGNAMPAALAGTAVALGGLRAGVEAGAQSQGEANQHIGEITAEMERTRASQREIAALRGEAPTGAFAAQMAREAAGAGISPDQYQQFQTGVQAYAGQFRGTKFDPAQFDRLQQKVASYAVGSKGLAPSDSARLLGTLMDKAKPGASDEEIMSQYAKSMSVMQLAPGYTGPLLGQLSEVAGEAVGPNGDFSNVTDASILLRGVAQRNPAQASAYTRALLRGLREARMSPKESKALGITKGMNTFEQIEAVQRAADKATAAGQDEGEFLTQHGFGEIRQYGGLRTALDSGLRGGGFARARAEADRVNAGTLEADRQSYLAGQEGGSQRDRGLVEAARLERANRYAALQRYRRQAELSVEGSGELEQGEGLGAVATYFGRRWGMGDRREQEVRAETGRLIDQRLRNFRGFPGANEQAQRFLDEQVPAAIGPGTVRREQRITGRFASDDEMAKAANFLEQLVEQGKREEQRRAAEAKNAPPAAGVTVRQPRPAGRMGMGPDLGRIGGPW